MNFYAIYDLITGEIKRTIMGTNGAIQTEAGEGFLIVPADCSDETHFIDPGTGEVMMKANSPVTIDSVNIAANGIDAATLNNIPVGSLVIVDFSSPFICDDGFLEFTSDELEETKITVKHPRFLDFQVMINAA